MDAKKWAEVCEYAAWFYQMTAVIRFEPYGTARPRPTGTIGRASGSRPGAARVLVHVPGVGTQIVPPGEPPTLGLHGSASRHREVRGGFPQSSRIR